MEVTTRGIQDTAPRFKEQGGALLIGHYTFQNTRGQALDSCSHWVHSPDCSPYHDVSHGATLSFPIGGNDDIHILHNTLESLVQLFWLQLQLQQCSVHLIHHQDRLDPLSNGLSQHSFCLYTHTWKRQRQNLGDYCCRTRMLFLYNMHLNMVSSSHQKHSLPPPRHHQWHGEQLWPQKRSLRVQESQSGWSGNQNHPCSAW